MYSSAVVALALAAAVAPALAAPSAVYPNPYAAKREASDILARSNRDALMSREVADLIARGFWQDFGEGFKKGFVGTLKAVAPIIPALLRREDLEMLARGEMTEHFSREDIDALMARGFWQDFGEGFKKGFVGTIKTLAPIVPAFLKRENLELMARETMMEHFSREDVNALMARGFWHDFGEGFKKGFVGTIKTLAPIVPALLRREDLELMARETMMEHFSRADILERSPEDNYADGYKKGLLLGLRNFNPHAGHYIEPPHLDLLAQHHARGFLTQREYEDLVARGFWSGFVDTVKQAGEAILPIVPDLVKAYRGKRGLESPELEMFARQFSMNELD